MSNSIGWVRAGVVAAVGFAALAFGGGTSPAVATGQNGVCEAGEFCLWYGSDHTGSMVDLAGSWSDYGTGSGCVQFRTPGAGRLECVKNNTASVWNRESYPVTVFYRSGYAGAIDAIASGAKVNLKADLKNENAGHVVGRSGNETLPGGLYGTSGGRITAYFDGYLSHPDWRHEGIDIARGAGSGVHALLGGTVVGLCESCGTTGLSTIAIYNAAAGKTVVYLHTNPVDSLDAGDSVTRGQLIATESSRGADATHTHVEVRDGQHTGAATSKDSVLVNDSPTTFWLDRGYDPAFD
jgi:hypothetical protein